MKVYLLVDDVEYDGETVRAVYATKELAEEAKAHQQAFGRFRIDEFTVLDTVAEAKA